MYLSTPPPNLYGGAARYEHVRFLSRRVTTTIRAHSLVTSKKAPGLTAPRPAGLIAPSGKYIYKQNGAPLFGDAAKQIVKCM